MDQVLHGLSNYPSLLRMLKDTTLFGLLLFHTVQLKLTNFLFRQRLFLRSRKIKAINLPLYNENEVGEP